MYGLVPGSARGMCLSLFSLLALSSAVLFMEGVPCTEMGGASPAWLREACQLPWSAAVRTPVSPTLEGQTAGLTELGSCVAVSTIMLS